MRSKARNEPSRFGPTVSTISIAAKILAGVGTRVESPDVVRARRPRFGGSNGTLK
jgi:hypothetical protein